MELTAVASCDEWSKGPLEKELREALGHVTNLELVKVTFACIYWRKANQIHKWFVDNLNGFENCETKYVSKKLLIKLRDECKEALDKKDPTILPTESGFFFGSTEVDEGYWCDIKYTLEKLEEIVKLDLEFHYHANW